MSPPAGRTRSIVIAAGLCAVVLAAYANSFSAGFALDSRQLVLNDTRVHAFSAENVELILQRSYWWPYGESGLYRPLTTLSYLVNYAILGSADRPAGYHWFNLLVHLANVWLVWLLVRRLSTTLTAPAAAAAIWGVHPLSTEAVTNIVGRADLLSAFGVLAGLLSYLNVRAAADPRRSRWLPALLLASVVAAFAKESGIALAATIALYEMLWWDRRRSARTLTAAALPVGLPMVAMLVQRYLVLSAAPVAEFPFIDNPIGGAGLVNGRLGALHVIALYLGKLVWPATLSVDYSYNQIPLDAGPRVLGSALFVTALAALAIWFRRANREAFFLIAFAALTLLPASNLLLATGTIMAERLMYLPSAGLIAAAMIVAFDLARSRRGVAIVTAVVLLCVIAESVRTWTRNRDWQDDVTLWSSAVAASPASSKAHRALAEALYAADSGVDFARVIAESEQSVTLIASLPDELSSFQSYRQAGAAHLDRGERQRRAAGEGPAPPDARASYERAIVLLEKGIAVAAASGARIGADRSRQQSDAHRMLAAAALGLGDGPRAIDQAARARQLNPADPDVHRMLANVYLGTHQDERAAIALLVGSMVTPDQTFRANVIELYRASSAASCALSTTPLGVAINPACSLVHDHLCAAFSESIAISDQIHNAAQANTLRASAEQLRCPQQ